MASEIPCFVLFGIIILVNGSPLFKNLTRSEVKYNLKDLVQNFNKLGNYNVRISHHEDRPGNHHEDVAQISYSGQTKGIHNNYDGQNRYADTNQGYNERQPNNNKPALEMKSLYDILYHFGKSLGMRTEEKNDGNGSKKNCMKKLGTCTELIWSPSNETSVRTFNGNSDEVAKFLNKLDKELGLTVDNDYDNKLEYNNNDNNRDNMDTSNDNDERNNANYNQHLRCIGDRCSRRANDVYYNDDDEYNRYDGADGNKNILRCSGASCGRSRLPRVNNDAYETNILRCIGNRCSKFDNNDRDSIDSLRCIRDRCMTDDFSESLRCVGNKCSWYRNMDSDSDTDSDFDSDSDSDSDSDFDSDSNSDSDTDTDTDSDSDSDTDSNTDSHSDSDDYDDNEFTDDDDTRMDSKVALTISELGLNNLRCRGNLCTYTDDSNSLRCIGNRCARDRDVDDGDIVDRIKLEGLRCNGNRCNRDTDDENYDIKAVRCSENRCSRDRNDNEGDSNQLNAIVKDDELLGDVDTLLTNVLAKNLRANTLLEDEDVQMLLKERKKIMKEVKKIMSHLKSE